MSREEVETLARPMRAVQNVGEVRGGVLRLARERWAECHEELAKRVASEFKIRVEERAWGKILSAAGLLGCGVLDHLVLDPYVGDVHVQGHASRSIWASG